MLTEAQERRITRRLPKQQQRWADESDALQEEKSGLKVRRVPKGYIQEHGRRSLQIDNAFTAAGEQILWAQQEIGQFYLTKDEMLDLGIWPLMSNGSVDRQSRLGSNNGDFQGKFSKERLERAVESINKKRPDFAQTNVDVVVDRLKKMGLFVEFKEE